MDIETKTEYVVTWIIRDKDGNIKEMGNDSPENIRRKINGNTCKQRT